MKIENITKAEKIISELRDTEGFLKNLPHTDNGNEIFIQTKNSEARLEKLFKPIYNEIFIKFNKAAEIMNEDEQVWKELPNCPQCSYTVQLEWKKCPICGFKLSD